MAKIERFEELKIWQAAVKISIDIFRISDEPPIKHDYGTKDQIRRAALSISSNIAEGFEYNSHLEFLRFLKYAKGLAGELRSQLFILNKLDLISETFYKELNQKNWNNYLNKFLPSLNTLKIIILKNK